MRYRFMRLKLAHCAAGRLASACSPSSVMLCGVLGFASH